MTTSTNSNSFDSEIYREKYTEFNEKVNKYYELKSIYEEAIQDKKKKNSLALRSSKKEIPMHFKNTSKMCELLT